MIRWCEIGNEPSKERNQALSEVLTAAGAPNEFEFIEFSGDPEQIYSEAKKFAQVRLSGTACEAVLRAAIRVPSTILPLKAADALAHEKDGEWWPRCFYVEGLNRTFAKSKLDLDFTGGIFVLGATPESRWVISSLSRIGYNKVSLCEPDEARGQSFVEDIRRTYFKMQVQYVPRHLLTQLPGVHSVAVNTLAEGRDDGVLAELFYFNFLKPGGAWLDLTLAPFNQPLEAEARSVGANIIEGHRVHAIADCLWAETCLGVNVDVDAQIATLSRLTGRTS